MHSEQCPDDGVIASSEAALCLVPTEPGSAGTAPGPPQPMQVLPGELPQIEFLPGCRWPAIKFSQFNQRLVNELPNHRADPISAEWGRANVSPPPFPMPLPKAPPPGPSPGPCAHGLHQAGGSMHSTEGSFWGLSQCPPRWAPSWPKALLLVGNAGGQQILATVTSRRAQPPAGV